MRIHIVQKGDTLWKIAQKYGVDFEQLKSLNSHLSDPDMIMPGMKIKIPSESGKVKKKFPAKEKSVKEKPDAEHPFMQVTPPMHPVHQPVYEQPKEIIKKVPKPVYTPKPVQPVIPEIDINNYYMVNMAKMNVEKHKPKVEKPVKEKPEKKKELMAPEETMEEKEEQPQTMTVHPPAFMPVPCIPVTPVLPGSGLPCWPFGGFYYPGFYSYPPAAMPLMPPMPLPQHGIMQPGAGSQHPGMTPGTEPAWNEPADTYPDMMDDGTPQLPVQSVHDQMIPEDDMYHNQENMAAPQPGYVQPGIMYPGDDCGCGGPSFTPMPSGYPEHPMHQVPVHGMYMHPQQDMGIQGADYQAPPMMHPYAQADYTAMQGAPWQTAVPGGGWQTGQETSYFARQSDEQGEFDLSGDDEHHQYNEKDEE